MYAQIKYLQPLLHTKIFTIKYSTFLHFFYHQHKSYLSKCTNSLGLLLAINNCNIFTLVFNAITAQWLLFVVFVIANWCWSSF